MRGALLVAAGGAVGSVLRYALGVGLTRGEFPWGTLAVNLLGSFLIGLLLFSGFARDAGGLNVRLLLATGLLGGFTTMSSFAFEATTMSVSRAGAYVVLTVAGSLAMAVAGRAVAQLLT